MIVTIGPCLRSSPGLRLQFERGAAKLAASLRCLSGACCHVSWPIKGPASYFPAIEKKYGRAVGEWQQIVRDALPARHMELVAMLKDQYGMGHGHANAIVAYVLATTKT